MVSQFHINKMASNFGKQGQMSGQMRSSKQNTIEEDTEESNSDAIRVYGATKDRSKPSGYLKYCSSQADDKVKVWIQDPHLHLPTDDTASCDGIMRGDDISENEYDPSQPCWRHPKIRENWKMVLAAAALLFVGLALFWIGVALTVSTSFSQGVVFFIAGVICFIPGVYHVIYIYLAVKGRPGYYFYHLPLFN